MVSGTYSLNIPLLGCNSVRQEEIISVTRQWNRLVPLAWVRESINPCNITMRSLPSIMTPESMLGAEGSTSFRSQVAADTHAVVAEVPRNVRSVNDILYIVSVEMNRIRPWRFLPTISQGVRVKK